MGSDLSRQMCCGPWKNGKGEDANEESSETKPILQTPRERLGFLDTLLFPPPLPVSKLGSEEVQDCQPPADAAEERTEPCSAEHPTGMTMEWDTAWDSTDFSVTPADGQTQGEVEVPDQLDNQQEMEQVGNAEEKIKPGPGAPEAQPVTQMAWDTSPEAAVEASSEGSPRAGVTLQERNIPSFIEITSETPSSQDWEINPHAEMGEGFPGRNLLLCAVQVAEETKTYLSAEHVEETGMARLPEVSPQCNERAGLLCLVETTTLLTVQDMQGEAVNPSEVVANVLAEAAPWESLYGEGRSPVLADELLDFLQQGTGSGVAAAQEMESLPDAELSQVSHQSSDGILGDLENEESRGCDAETPEAEAEPQHRVMQQVRDLPEEPLPCAQVSEEPEFLTVALALPQAPGSSGEPEAENAEA